MTSVCFLDKKTVILSCHPTQISLTCKKLSSISFGFLRKDSPCWSLSVCLHPALPWSISLSTLGHSRLLHLALSAWPLCGLGAGPCCWPFSFPRSSKHPASFKNLYLAQGAAVKTRKEAAFSYVTFFIYVQTKHDIYCKHRTLQHTDKLHAHSQKNSQSSA